MILGANGHWLGTSGACGGPWLHGQQVFVSLFIDDHGWMVGVVFKPFCLIVTRISVSRNVLVFDEKLENRRFLTIIHVEKKVKQTL